MKIAILLISSLLLCGEDKKEQKKPPRDPRNVRQYDYQSYCRVHFFYFDRPELMVRAYPDLFAKMSPDVALAFVRQKMLHNLRVAGCEW